MCFYVYANVNMLVFFDYRIDLNEIFKDGSLAPMDPALQFYLRIPPSCPFTSITDAVAHFFRLPSLFAATPLKMHDLHVLSGARRHLF